MDQAHINHFQAFGFLQLKQLLAPAEIQALSAAFDHSMSKARQGAAKPQPGEKRQQVIPFFDYDPATFYPLLDDSRFLDVFAQLLGDDFIFTLSEGIIHTGGTGWHHDACAPEGFFSMRAAIYLDPLGPEDGCLSVVPGSHFAEFRQSLGQTLAAMDQPFATLPGTLPLVNEPGDVLFMNHKLYHAALGQRPWRRAIHINCVQNTTPQKNQTHYDWLYQFLKGETKGWGRFYSDHLLESAGPRRQKMLAGAIAMGFGNTGPITHLQDLK